MTDIYVQPGAEKYVKFGKAKLAALRALRIDLGLPSLRKSYVPEAGSRVDIGTTDDHDYVRCWGGGLWPVGLYLPPPPPYTIRETMLTESYAGGLGLLQTHTLVLVVGAGFGGVGGTVVETYTGTKNTFSEFFSDHAQQTITYTAYPGGGMTIESGLGTGQQMDGVIFTNTAGGGFNTTHVTNIPNFGVAADAAVNRPIIEVMAAGVLQEDWKTEILGNDPLDPATPFTEVQLAPFEAVQGGVARGMFPASLPVGIDEIQVYGVATHRYNHDTDVWTFVNWKPVSTTAPYVRIPYVVPAIAWPVLNFASNYGVPKKTDIHAAAAARAALNPVLTAVLRAVRA